MSNQCIMFLNYSTEHIVLVCSSNWAINNASLIVKFDGSFKRDLDVSKVPQGQGWLILKSKEKEFLSDIDRLNYSVPSDEEDEIFREPSTGGDWY